MALEYSSAQRKIRIFLKISGSTLCLLILFLTIACWTGALNLKAIDKDFNNEIDQIISNVKASTDPIYKRIASLTSTGFVFLTFNKRDQKIIAHKPSITSKQIIKKQIDLDDGNSKIGSFFVKSFQNKYLIADLNGLKNLSMRDGASPFYFLGDIFAPSIFMNVKRLGRKMVRLIKNCDFEESNTFLVMLLHKNTIRISNITIDSESKAIVDKTTSVFSFNHKQNDVSSKVMQYTLIKMFGESD